MVKVDEPTLGASVEENGVRFRVWAPATERAEVVLEPSSQSFSMKKEDDYFTALLPNAKAGDRYRYRLDGGNTFPDPASRFQPEGVHGPSQVVDPNAYAWSDAGWQGVPQKELVFYELHVGTFSPEGRYEGVRQKLSYLKELGITAIELMPLADFPGERGWGYDPAAFFAPAHAYGAPDELRRLVDEAHAQGLAVFLDVVYNHFGPDGAYLPAYSPFVFTDRHHTPWGQAVNLDGQGSEGVRRFFLENALHWLREYHFDGFRLDATFALIDDSPKHFLVELSEIVERVPGWRRTLVAEDPRNMRALLEPRSSGGYGLDAVWADDFHHQMRRRLAGDRHGYYQDFSGSNEDLATTLNQGWFFSGQHSENEGGPRGTDPAGLPKEAFVLCIQNHDQIGNRPQGNRLSDDASPAAFRAASAALLFAPELPLIFMGQEWGADTPFQYFTDHNEELGKLVSKGRKEEFKDFPGFGGEVPDPQDEASFNRSKLEWDELNVSGHAKTLQLYKDLLRTRRDLSGDFEVQASGGGLVLKRGRHVLLVALDGGGTVSLEHTAVEGDIRWQTESDAYTDDPKPARVEGNKVHFEVPGAALLEVNA